MPNVQVRWSWDIELADVDNDGDLDLLIASKSGTGSFLFENDGTGKFSDATAGRIPQFGNNYEFEAMDMNGDGALDLVTINDGAAIGTDKFNRPEHVFINNGKGTFADATATLWLPKDNIGKDDNVAAFLDYDSDGDADVLIGSLSEPDRLLVNDGTGKLTLAAKIFSGTATPGTLGIGLADLDGDQRIDVVMSQGEVAFDERIFLGSGIKRDTAKPSCSILKQTANGASQTILARVHDRKTPIAAHDFQSVVVQVKTADGKLTETPMRWYGEALFRATVPLAAGATATVCAVDAAGNRGCSK
jgi:hypothetical protein